MTARKDEPGLLRVGTFNVRWASPADEHGWPQRRTRSLEMLRAWAPGVLGLQEPISAQVADIAAGLPDYTLVGVGREDGREAGEFCPILYRTDRFVLEDSGTFWLSATPSLPGSKTWGNRIPRICTWAHLRERDGPEFSLYNVHLDHESQSAREQGAQLLIDTLRQRPGGGPVILTGDFNAEPDNPAIRRLQAEDSPVPVSALALEQPPGTFHGFTGKASGGPIDYIFLSPDWRVLEAQVLTGDGAKPFPSDHFSVAATLQWPPLENR